MLPYIFLVYYNGHGILQIRNKETERIKLFSIVFTIISLLFIYLYFTTKSSIRLHSSKTQFMSKMHSPIFRLTNIVKITRFVSAMGEESQFL